MRKNSRSKLVTNAMLIGISAMLALSQPMAAMAGEFTENGGVDRAEAGWHDLTGDNAPNTEDAQYNDAATEAQKAHDASSEVAAFETAAANAETAASEAAAAVKKVQEEVEHAEEAINTANQQVTVVEENTKTVEEASEKTVIAGATTEIKESTMVTVPEEGNTEVADPAGEGVSNPVPQVPEEEKLSQESEDPAEEKLGQESEVPAEDTKPAEGNPVVDDNQPAAETDHKEEKTKEVDVEKYAADKADEAEDYAAEAKKALENALAVDTDEVNEEVLKYVDQVYAAADQAVAAKNEAEAAVTQATDNLEAAVEKYNTEAAKQGLPKLVKNTETGEYELEESSTLMAETDSLKQQLTTATTTADTTIQELATTVANTQATVDAAKTAYNTAATKAKKAEEAADEAAQLVVDKVNEATTEADKAIYDDVNDAQENLATKTAAVEATSATITEKTTALGTAQAALTIAQNEQNVAQADYNTAWNARNAAAQAAYEAKCAEYYRDYENESSKWWNKATKAYKYVCYWTYVHTHSQNDFYNKVDNTALNAASATLNQKKSATQAAQTTVNNLTNEIGSLNSTLTKQNAEKATAESELNATETAQETLEAQIVAAYNAEDSEKAKQALKDALNEVIMSYAVDINQAQYDKALNEYVNQVWNGWNWDTLKVVTKAQIREELDDVYDEYYDNFWKDLGDDLKDVANTIGISQWLVNTDEVDDLIAQCTALSTAAIQEQYKQMAIIDASFAKLDAAETLKNASTPGTDKPAAITVSIDDNGVPTGAAPIITGDIEDSKVKMTEALGQYETAKGIYDNAKEEYKDALAKVQDVKASAFNYEELMNAVKDAEQKLANARTSLTKAENQASIAINYANWAEALSGKEYTPASENAPKAEPAMLKVAALRSVNAVVQQVPVKKDVKEKDDTDAEQKIFADSLERVDIPYALFREFVKQNYDLDVEGNEEYGTPEQTATYDTTQKSNTVYMWRVEDGVAIEFLKVVFDANGNPVSVNGQPVSSLNGTFFVASALTSLEDEMYALDGDTVEINYTAPAPVANVTTNVTTTATTTTTTEVAVLGESREPETVEEEEPAVLGADRPQTGDDANAGAMAGVMAAAATALAGIYFATKKRKDEEEA